MPLRSALVTLVTVLALVGQGARVAHLALERHVECPQHGDLLHAEDASSREAGAPALARGAEGDHGGHHHCALACDPPGPLSCSAPPAATALALGTPPRAAGHPAPAGVTGIAVLRLAPKHGPPPPA